MFRGESVFICPNCGKKFVAPDIELGATAKSQPMPCPHCGTLTDKKSVIPASVFKWFN
ncbi:MAG: hypothetical protein MJ010_02695 [Paludibacteraceae bacterium]|nr:hypothetical protein [Paludibacteraceae bacterium]